MLELWRIWLSNLKKLNERVYSLNEFNSLDKGGWNSIPDETMITKHAKTLPVPAYPIRYWGLIIVYNWFLVRTSSLLVHNGCGTYNLLTIVKPFRFDEKLDKITKKKLCRVHSKVLDWTSLKPVLYDPIFSTNVCQTFGTVMV